LQLTFGTGVPAVKTDDSTALQWVPFRHRRASEGTGLMPIESGRTRCPRCAAWTDYLFLERGDNKLEYEVRCSACGNVHSEITVLATATMAAA
jgi:hypothetical protein